MKKTQFRPHGECNIWSEDNFVVVHTYGPWDAEHVRLGHQLIMEEAKAFNGKPWRMLGIVHGESIHTVESQEEQIRAIRIQQAHGRIGTALVWVDAPETRQFLAEIFLKMYARAGEPVQTFPDEASARAWLKEHRELGACNSPR
ncbi:MAG: hypothetical protein BWY57_00039 [Betaproteobacteria bacterium ADurb.Bin341]|nr:MAG: hypothetical protein BWY57_00039 [Betaproteobacteria bacterium ADurb.Bin341]